MPAGIIITLDIRHQKWLKENERSLICQISSCLPGGGVRVVDTEGSETHPFKVCTSSSRAPGEEEVCHEYKWQLDSGNDWWVHIDTDEKGVKFLRINSRYESRGDNKGEEILATWIQYLFDEGTHV